MPIVVACPGCPAQLSAPDTAAGKQIRCPKCKAVVAVPAFVPVEEEPVVEATVVPPKPKPTSKPAPVDDDDDRPRKKATARRDEEDEDDEDDRPRKKKRKASRRLSSGALLAIIFGGILVLGGGAFGVYTAVTKKGLFSTKSRPPAGWQPYTSADDGFRCHFPAEPQVSHPELRFVGKRGLGGPAGKCEPNEVMELESVTGYNHGERGRTAVSVSVLVVRYKERVPDSARKSARDYVSPAAWETASPIKWLGRDAVEVTSSEWLTRDVYTDRTLYRVMILTDDRELRRAFFDNFELTK